MQYIPFVISAFVSMTIIVFRLKKHLLASLSARCVWRIDNTLLGTHNWIWSCYLHSKFTFHRALLDFSSFHCRWNKKHMISGDNGIDDFSPLDYMTFWQNFKHSICLHLKPFATDVLCFYQFLCNKDVSKII